MFVTPNQPSPYMTGVTGQSHVITMPGGGTVQVSHLDWKNFCQIFHLACQLILILSLDESRGYLGFSTVTPLPQRFPFGRDNLKNILVRPFKLGMWVYMGNATSASVL